MLTCIISSEFPLPALHSLPLQASTSALTPPPGPVCDSPSTHQSPVKFPTSAQAALVAPRNLRKTSLLLLLPVPQNSHTHPAKSHKGRWSSEPEMESVAL